ncbi:MAG: two-component system sensor histidine kinase CreC [Chthoniobacteraceae bacterium]
MIKRLSLWFSEFVDGLFLSIRARIILSYLVIVGVGFICLTRKMADDVRPRYLEAEEETMVDIANVLASVAEQSWIGDQTDFTSLRAAYHSARARKFSAPIYELTKSSLDLHVYATDATGRVVFDSNDGKAVGADYSRFNDVYLTLRGKYGSRSTRTVKADSSTSVLYVAAPIRHNGQIAGVLTVAKPLASMGAFMQRTQKRILLFGTVAAAGVVLLGVLFSAWLTYPIQNLIAYSKAIRDGHRTPRPHLGHSEMRTLGLAFEEMRDALEGKDYVNRYVQTLTHEMKSPVAAIQGAAELLQEEMQPEDRRKFLANIQTETVRIQEAVDSLLLLASVESKKSLDHAVAVDLCELVRCAVEKLSVRISVRAVQVVCDFPEVPPMASGDAFLLERTVLNLLENAVAFTPEGSTVAIIVRHHEGLWRLIVEDSGPGIPDYALSRVFERFYSLPRPDTGRKSSGLGLAFVREVALLHGGTVELSNRHEGGARAVLSLPENI